jgi:putative tryptophan/tyrosine transport system substrate-binding protein
LTIVSAIGMRALRPASLRAALLRAALLSGLAFALAEPALADERPFSKWFRYGSEVDAGWNVTADPVKPATQLSIRRKAADVDGPKKKVLVLYPRQSSAYDIAITNVLRVFEEKELNAEFTVINFELKDEPGKEAIQFAEKNKFDLIFSMGSESTAWLYSGYRGGSIPVVSICSKDPVQLGQMKDYDSGSGSNFAFTSLNVPIEVQIAYVRDLKPDLKNIAILVDSKNVSAVQTQAEPIAQYAKQHDIGVIWTAVQNPTAAQEELRTKVPAAVREMQKTDPDLSKSLFWLTGSTSVFAEIRTINEAAGRVPVVSVVPEIVSPGKDTAVLGIGISFESNAHLAAIYGADILTGRSKAGELKVGIVSPPDIAISFLRAREIGLRIPFDFFETASFIYDYEGRPVRTMAHQISIQN